MPAEVEVEVLEANEAFYQAFARADLRAMEELWARDAPVACVHPGWGVLRGRTDVMASWRAVLREPPPIRCAKATAHVLGEAAFVVCQEVLPGARLAATNVFVREDGRWRLAHHQAGAIAAARGEPPETPPIGTLN